MAIDDIKKFIADKELEEGNLYVPEKKDSYEEKVAVIGAGPAGMTAAYYLAVEGYPVTVFEKNAAPGGMLKFGIPSFRLKKDVIDAEIEVLRRLGVEFKCGVDVGRDVTIEQLREQGYKAFYVAIGAQASRKLGIEGEELIGVQGGINFLRGVNEGVISSVEGDTVVIGGGNVAMDATRTVLRLCARGQCSHGYDYEKYLPHGLLILKLPDCVFTTYTPVGMAAKLIAVLPLPSVRAEAVCFPSVSNTSTGEPPGRCEMRSMLPLNEDSNPPAALTFSIATGSEPYVNLLISFAGKEITPSSVVMLISSAVNFTVGCLSSRTLTHLLSAFQSSSAFIPSALTPAGNNKSNKVNRTNFFISYFG